MLLGCRASWLRPSYFPIQSLQAERSVMCCATQMAQGAGTSVWVHALSLNLQD